MAKQIEFTKEEIENELKKRKAIREKDHREQMALIDAPKTTGFSCIHCGQMTGISTNHFLCDYCLHND